MSAAKATAVALIAFGGVTIPAAGAAHAEEPLLCGVLSPCEPSPDDDAGDTNSQPVPVPVPAPIEPDVAADVDVLPLRGRVIDAAADVDSAAQIQALDRALEADIDTALDTAARAGLDGVLVTGDGVADAGGTATLARRLADVDLANRICGVQVVIATSSSANCQPGASGNASGAGGAVMSLSEALDICGVHVVVAGSATTDCAGQSGPAGGPSRPGSPARGSSWTLVDAAATGSVCGLAVAVAGESQTTCSNPPQGAAGSGSDVNGSASLSGPRPGSASGAQGAQAETAGGGDAAAMSAGSGESLPVTGLRTVLLLVIAAATLAEGLLAQRLSQIRSRWLF